MRLQILVTVLSQSNAVALVRAGPLINKIPRKTCCRGLPLLLHAEALVDQPPMEQLSSGEVDLASLGFDERLKILAAQIPDIATPEIIDKGIFPKSCPETQFWRPEFWRLCTQDVRELVWPSRKQAFQMLFVTQLVLTVSIVVIFVFDVLAKSAVMALLKREPLRCG